MTPFQVKKLYVTGGIGLVCFLSVFLVSSNPWISWDIENWFFDQRLKNRKDLPTDSRAVLIDIDDRSIEQLGRWPWDRSLHANMIRILSRSGAAVIGYDILFAQAGDPKDDRLLVEAVREAGNVFLPVGYDLKRNSNGKGILSVTREIGPFPELRSAAAGVGHISSNRDPDGTIRRVPLIVQSWDRQVPAFSLSLVAGYSGVPREGIVYQPGEGLILSDAFPSVRGMGDGRKIPVDREAMMLINYAGPWIRTFDHFSFVDILNAWNSGTEKDMFTETFAGKICLVSHSATGYDLKPVPHDPNFPGGGIHANAVNTILTERYLSPASPWMTFGLVATGAWVIAMVAVWSSWWIGMGIAILLIFLLFGINALAFQSGTVLEIFPSIQVILFTFVSVLIYEKFSSRRELIKISREKEQITKAYGEIRRFILEKETLLQENRAELSRLKEEVEQAKDQDRRRVERIQSVEEDLEKVGGDQMALVREKKRMEERMADFLTQPGRAGGSPSELGPLHQEFFRFGIMTRNPEMIRLFQRAKKASLSQIPVLIQGETGTGKELFAWAIHKLSPRSDKPFVTVNIPTLQENLIQSELFGHLKGSFTSAISDKKGKFQIADGGTIFLDEIGEMKPDLQAKLLRILQTGEMDQIGAPLPVRVNVRVIAATHRDLLEEVKNGHFREDLYYRLFVLSLNLPPLRKRPEDISLLADYFLKKYALETGRTIREISVKGKERLMGHPWIGNVRELEQTIARGITLATGDQITEADLELEEKPSAREHRENVPNSGGGILPLGDSLSDEAFVELLRKNQFEIGKTARSLGITAGTVGSRFKGICFVRLAENHCDFDLAARTLSDHREDQALVGQKIREYYQNLMEMIQTFDSRDEAIQESRRRYKNLRQKYFDGLEKLINRYFEKVLTEKSNFFG